VVGTLSVTAQDTNDSHTFAPPSDSRFEIVGDQLKLKDGQSLDHETEASVEVAITAEDQAGATHTQTFTITVQDMNEPPTDISLSATAVDENAPGAIIGTLDATDPDDGDTATFTVSDNRFEVVGDQLKLKDGQSLDHETEPTVRIEVTAHDQGDLTYTEAFDITVNDVNDPPTDITLDPASVDEIADGAVIGNVTAVDQDAGDTHAWTVSDDRFEVAQAQLKLKAGEFLDFEVEPAVTVQLTATDSGNESVTRTFTITVNDVNEPPMVANAIPDQTAMENVPYSFTFAENTFSDVDQNDVLTYQATRDDGSDLPDWLSFDGTTRTFSGRPTFTDEGQFVVLVRATDSGTPGLFAETTFTMTVEPNPSPWQNPVNPWDVDDSGQPEDPVPLDVLTLINFINEHGIMQLPEPPSPLGPPPYVDVDGDGWVKPLDVLGLINLINERAANEGEGEAAGDAIGRAAATGRSELAPLHVLAFAEPLRTTSSPASTLTTSDILSVSVSADRDEPFPTMTTHDENEWDDLLDALADDANNGSIDHGLLDTALEEVIEELL